MSDWTVESVLNRKAFNDLCERLRGEEYICLDLETKGPTHMGREANFFQWHPLSRIVSVSFTFADDDQTGWVVPLCHPESPWGYEWRAKTALLAEAMTGAKLIGHNCFTPDTEFLTRAGWEPLEKYEGKQVTLFDGEKWVKSRVYAYAEEEVYELDIRPAQSSRAKVSHKVRATANHRWETTTGEILTTTDLRLRPLPRLKASAPRREHDEEGYRHGLIFADGSVTSKSPLKDGRFRHQMRLCGDKKDKVNLFDKANYYPSNEGDPVVYHYADYSMKELPEAKSPEDYEASFLQGWIDLDGTDHRTGGRVLTTVDEEAYLWVIDSADRLGWCVTGHGKYKSSSKLSEKGYFFSVILKRPEIVEWEVRSITPAGKSKVMCPSVPTDRFTLRGGILTCNSKYEVRWLNAKTDVDLTDRQWWDTATAAKLIDENKSARLKSLMADEFGDWGIDITDAEAVPWYQLAKYNALDTIATMALLHRQYAWMQRNPEIGKLFRKVVMPSQRALTAMEGRGLGVDLQAVDDEIRQAEESCVPTDKILRDHAFEVGMDLRKVSWNANSLWFKEFMRRVADKYDYPIAHTTNGNESWDKLVLLRLAAQDERAGRTDGVPATLLAHRKNVTKLQYLRVWHKNASELPDRPRLHPSFNMGGARTGRLTSSSPNGQQLSRELKHCFIGG